MINYAQQVGDSHAIVWRYRDELQDVWPTPPGDDTLRFAYTEAAEAMDAWLRLRGGYARNNDKALSVEDELADCAMMLLTTFAIRPHIFRLAYPDSAIMGDWADLRKTPATRYYLLEPDPYSPVNILHNVAYRIGELLVSRGGNPHGMILRLVGLIACYPGMDLPARITARLERIKAKRSINREGNNG